MDFIGPIDPASRHMRYTIVCTNYLAKWVEKKEIRAATKYKVAKFLRENIFYKFGYPMEIVTDQGTKITSNFIEDLTRQHHINHKTSTSYHSQAHGKVEVINKALENILTKVVSNNMKDWAKGLVEATWACNTTEKTTIEFTPYDFSFY